MKIYVAGQITGLPNFMEKFADAVNDLKAQGHWVMNPALLPSGFSQGEYMRICFAMIDACDAIYLLDNWKNSEGAQIEYHYAKKCDKQILFQADEKN
jgi:hypothetical protein